MSSAQELSEAVRLHVRHGWCGRHRRVRGAFCGQSDLRSRCAREGRPARSQGGPPGRRLERQLRGRRHGRKELATSAFGPLLEDFWTFLADFWRFFDGF